jgi:hypothetical protein
MQLSASLVAHFLENSRLSRENRRVRDKDQKTEIVGGRLRDHPLFLLAASKGRITL